MDIQEVLKCIKIIKKSESSVRTIYAFKNEHQQKRERINHNSNNQNARSYDLFEKYNA